MKILHSSDFHIVNQGDYRWQALEEVVAVGKRERVDFFAISGDLFDSDIDANELRPEIRGLFEDTEFITFIIPGNHDSESFSPGLFFGDRVRVLADPDWAKNIIETDELQFIGIPFEPLDGNNFRKKLREIRSFLDPQKKTVLLYHGELLDISFDRDSFGPESGRYMPSRLAFFEDLESDYVLAGHFHIKFNILRVGQKGYFVYPGSPVSITRKETGRRKIALIEVGQEPRPIEINTRHFHNVDVFLNAFSPNNPAEEIKNQLIGIDPNAIALLRVGGTILGAEEQLVNEINNMISGTKIETSQLLFRDISRVISHPVYELFESRLKELSDVNGEELDAGGRNELLEILIQAMAEIGL